MFNLHRWKINRLTKKVKAMQTNRMNNQPGDTELKKEILYYFELAALYKKLIGATKVPYADLMYIESLRAAAALDDSSAHYQLGKLFIDEAKYRQQLINAGLFNSQGNNKRCNELYEEGHAHLLAAEKLGHVEAKRLRGLCIINGWGKVADKNAGFELVVASIEQEGSWDRVPQIFASMGLNKPEFFSAIMQRRKDVP